MEDFLNIELAIKLKELGFNIPFFFYYRTDDKQLYHLVRSQPLLYGKDMIDDEVVIAPTISQVLKWFRKEKRIDAGAIWSNDDKVWVGYVNDMSMPDLLSDYVLPHNSYNSYEEAAMSAIEYILDNLI